MPPRVEHVDEVAENPSVIDGEEPPDVGVRQYASSSPTPSEHGSDASRLQLHASKVTDTATNNDTRPPSPVSSVSAEPFSNPRYYLLSRHRINVWPTDHTDSTRSSPTSSSSNSVVFVSADGIPDYIRENRAVLVATSAGSPSSGRTPLRLSSSSSLESLDMSGPRTREARVPTSTEDATAPRTVSVTHRLHCRICLRDPCEDMTATICGHVFCKRCVDAVVVRCCVYERRLFFCFVGVSRRPSLQSRNVLFVRARRCSIASSSWICRSRLRFESACALTIPCWSCFGHLAFLCCKTFFARTRIDRSCIISPTYAVS